MKEKKHVILDHVILSYFLLFIFAMIFISLGSKYIDSMILAKFIPGYGSEMTVMGKTSVSAAGLGAAMGAVLSAGLFYVWFRPCFKGMLKLDTFLKGFLLLLPFVVIHWIGSFIGWMQFGTSSVFLAFLNAFAPGFGEEIAYRGLGVANFMRKKNTEKGILTIFWISSVFFGLTHMVNALAGANPVSTALQSIYAIGVGMAFGAVYLRTGNILPCIIGHLSLDFLEFVRGDLGESNGLMMGLGIGDWITVLAAVIGAVIGLYLIRKARRQDIIDVWNEKWAGESS
ncbi:MAG: CPBP family intramembrane metalloprotease [Clostridiales bacterium]|nr:CPBP family intramembrane metalloprotease [Clostridiales bacterium]